MKPTLNIIGCGQAASSLASLWLQSGSLQIGAICNQSLASAEAAVNRLGSGQAVGNLDRMPIADAWLIGTSDQQIAPVAGALARILPDEPGGQLAFHLAGRFGTQVLAPLADRGLHVASVHPVRSLSFAKLTIEQFSGTVCVAQGDDRSLCMLEPLFRAIGAEWVAVEKINRGLYHAALSIISNVTKGVAWKAERWLEEAGLSSTAATGITNELLRTTQDDLFRSGPRQTITGPVVRGDTSTVEAHIDSLTRLNARDAELYRILARTVFELAQERGDLDQATLTRFRALLED